MQGKAMKKLTGWMVCVLLLLIGCNTVEGIGKDITKAGETIENASKKK
jgi:predicted small secreted protein